MGWGLGSLENPWQKKYCLFLVGKIFESSVVQCREKLYNTTKIAKIDPQTLFLICLYVYLNFWLKFKKGEERICFIKGTEVRKEWRQLWVKKTGKVTERLTKYRSYSIPVLLLWNNQVSQIKSWELIYEFLVQFLFIISGRKLIIWGLSTSIDFHVLTIMYKLNILRY